MSAAMNLGSRELDLYWNDRPAWLKLVAPRMAARLRAVPDDQISDIYGCLPRDYQVAVWAVLDDLTREAIKLARIPSIRTVRNCPMPERDLFTQIAGGVPA